MVLTKVSASSTPPSAPFAHTLASSTGTSISAHNSFKVAISAAVSVINSLIATTAGMPNLRIFSTWRFKLAKPARTASTFSSVKASLVTPPFILRARRVATITTASGDVGKFGVLISRNFSAPRSAPKPASVIV